MKNSKKIEKKAIEEMSFEEIMTILTSVSRMERFCDGAMYDFINSGKMMKCLKRIKALSNC